MGTFGGVFTPSFLTIIGIIFFMRLGYVVGQAGLVKACIIIALANSISVLTSISMAAIATNLRVKVGGVYYIISRTLGAEFGGAIGVVLYVAQSVSIAFYCLGFGEVLSGFSAGSPVWLPQIIAAAAVAVLFVFAWLGADWATKFQFAVMAVLVCAVVSFFAGAAGSFSSATLASGLSARGSSAGFWMLFALFFPAVTGFTQGVNMSGDLKHPDSSIPLGTFLAVGLTMLLYFAAAFLLAGSLDQETLTQDYAAMKRISVTGMLVDAGVIAATLSSAMASFLGAPRVLQSLAADRTIPLLLPFAKGYGPAHNPRRGVLLTAGIALATICLGDLNIIAPVVSMFFLVSYGLLNYATYFEARTQSPSFRPRFRFFNRRVSLAGWIACFLCMLAVDAAAGIVAIAVLIALYQYLERTSGPHRWADSRRSFHLQHLREHLLASSADPEHPRDWRPQILAFSDDSHRRERLLQFSAWLEGGSGVTTAVRMIEADGVQSLRVREQALREMKEDMQRIGSTAFPLVVAVPDIDEGFATVLQSFGIGALQVNTILLNRMKEMSQGVVAVRRLRYGRNLRTAFRYGCNIVILDADDQEWSRMRLMPRESRRIDIWWWDEETGRLMLLLAHLMKRSREWSDAQLRILIDRKDSGQHEVSSMLGSMLDDVRIDAACEVLGRVVDSTVVNYSRDAALVMLPMRLVDKEIVCPYAADIDELLRPLPAAALVLAAEDIDLGAEPEEGTAGEQAAVHDAALQALRKARESAKVAERARDKAVDLSDKLKKQVDSHTDAAEIERLKKEVRASYEESEKAARRAAKAAAQAESALAKAGTSIDGRKAVKNR